MLFVVIGVRCLLFVACCLLVDAFVCDVCCSPLVARCVLFVVCCLLFAVECVLRFVVGALVLFVVCCVLLVVSCSVAVWYSSFVVRC